MSQSIRRHYVILGQRRVHFRSAGNGPVVLFVHQSPQSSTAAIPLMEKLKANFCVIAPDSPGFGLSDPLSADTSTIEDIAYALNQFTDTIELPIAAVIGIHTGAEIALEYALRYPYKTNLLILDGLPLFTEESADILQHYLPAFIPSWDGSHLIRLWIRLREQTIFSPGTKKLQKIVLITTCRMQLIFITG